MGGFEILATLCLSALCAGRVLPTPEVLTQATCTAQASVVADRWAARHPDYTVQDATCVASETLAPFAATVNESAPGHFVHFGQVEEVGAGSNGDVANSGFVIGADSVAVIDTGTSRAIGEALYLAIRKQTDLPIRWLILTHMHPDHVLGAEVFREAGAELVAAAKMNPALALRGEPYLANMMRLLGPDAMHGTTLALADRAVTGPDVLDLGGGRLLDLTPQGTAHTDNDMTVFDRQSSSLWAGDLVFLSQTPALDGSINGWISALELLQNVPATQLIPGHGSVIAQHPDGTQPTLQYLIALREDVRQAIADGESLNTALRHVGSGLAADWLFFEANNPRNATNAYVELEWE